MPIVELPAWMSQHPNAVSAWNSMANDAVLVDPLDHEGRAEHLHDRAGLPADPPAWFPPPRLTAYQLGYQLDPDPTLHVEGYELDGTIHYRPHACPRRVGTTFYHEIIEGEFRARGVRATHGDVYRGQLAMAFPGEALRRLERRGWLDLPIALSIMLILQPHAEPWLLAMRLMGYRELQRECRRAV
jgi:hypothetical protein